MSRSRIGYLLRLASIVTLPLLTSASAAQEVGGEGQSSSASRDHTENRPDPVALGARLEGFGVWIAHAGSTVDASYGHSPGWGVTLAGARATWELAGSERLSVLYTMDLVPVARLTTPEEGRTTTCGRGRLCVTTESSAFGIGASPLGLHLAYRAHKAVRLHGGFTAGGMWFTERVPVTTASRLNFTVDVGTGVSFVRQSGAAVTLGYRVHHISNGWTAQTNPGMGAHMLAVGISWPRGGGAGGHD